MHQPRLNQLRKKHSRSVLPLSLLWLLVFTAGGLLLSDKVLGWTVLADETLVPEHYPGDTFVICKLPICKDLNPGETALLKNPSAPSQPPLLKIILGTPGEQVEFTRDTLRNGATILPMFRAPEIDRPGFLNLPAKGTQIQLKSVNNHFLDYFSWLIKRENPDWNLSMKNTFFRSGITVPVENLAGQRIKGRLLDSALMEQADWMDLQLLQLHLQRKHPEDTITLKREIYRDSLRLGEYQVKKNYFFVSGTQPKAGVDSRNFGLVPQDLIVGKAIPIPWLQNRGDDTTSQKENP